jgi:hypothetical protein
MSMYMSKEYLSLNETWHVEDSQWKSKQVLQLITSHNIKANTICEVGCGAGEILVQLFQALPCNVCFTGYDISPQLQNMWQERENDRIKFINRDFLESAEHYDILMFIDIIEHIEDYIGFLRKVRDRGNYKIFSFPLEIFALKAIMSHKYIDSRNKYGHIHYFNKDICVAVLRDLGFKIIDYFYAPAAIDLSSTSTSISSSSRMLTIPRILLSKISTDLTEKLLGGYSLFILTE